MSDSQIRQVLDEADDLISAKRRLQKIKTFKWRNTVRIRSVLSLKM